jgi:ketosteroid isomerase-like protein/catechol 2,3-dioxygenase-like lactoylglutathione lyase family enzyme
MDEARSAGVIGIDHVYVTVSDLGRSEAFYDRVMDVLGFRKSRFAIGGDPHVQYFNRHFGFVLRPARSRGAHDPYAPGLHHLCLRVDSIDDVTRVAAALRAAGIDATAPRLHPEYAPDYWATFLADPDGVRLEVTNYRRERRERHDAWAPADLSARVRRAYEAFAAGDPGPMRDLLAPDVVYHLPGRHLGGGTLRGRDEVLARTLGAAGECEAPPRIELIEVAGAGAFVTSVERFAARRRGRALDQQVSVVWRFAGERCVELWSHFADQAACDAFWDGPA